MNDDHTSNVEALILVIQNGHWYDTATIVDLYRIKPRTVHNQALRSGWRRRPHPTSRRRRQYNAADVQKTFGKPRATA